jgi:hypothetical protein
MQGKYRSYGPLEGRSEFAEISRGKIASRFQSVTKCALNGYYSDTVFAASPAFKLVKRMIELNESLSNVVWRSGHKLHFGAKCDDEGEYGFASSPEEPSSEYCLLDYPELSDVISLDEDKCAEPSKSPIEGRVKEIYMSSRGPEIGTGCDSRSSLEGCSS